MKMFGVEISRPRELAKCCKCYKVIDKNDGNECPLLFNSGYGPRYVCAECYPNHFMALNAEQRSMPNNGQKVRSPFKRVNTRR